MHSLFSYQLSVTSMSGTGYDGLVNSFWNQYIMRVVECQLISKEDNRCLSTYLVN